MSVDTKIAFDQDYIKSFSEKRQEPKWMESLRLKALEKSENLPMPKPDKTKIDKWNFTSFKHDVPADAISSLDDLPKDIRELVAKDQQSGNLLVHRNSTPVFHQLSEELKEQGVIFTDIQTALQEHGDLVEKYFMKDVMKVDENRLTAVHAALLNGGTFLYVPRNVEVDVPVQALYWQEDPEAGLFNHVIIVAEDNSSVTYVENYLSYGNDEESVANIIAEVHVGQNARVTFGSVDNFSKGVTTYVNRRANVARDGKVDWALAQMNDGNTVSTNTTHLIGDGSNADSKTVTIGRGDQKQNFTNQIIHHGKNSEGMLLVHGVQKDSASAIFNGVTKIEHGAAKSNGEQTQRVLMMNEKARGDANPILLIDEDDVMAGHAASVGKVDPIQLYYLQSRGISRHEAERLIIHGFLAPVINELPIEGVRKRAVEVTEGKVN
ncbi:Fe-S cluster assembly protein SufD [Alkalihalobacillus macyae]|uniref:Fe-S cluster assembly protein SufD n=1 Tax=Guptibacillus hwajinpoensis TaxID=208199 RepID=UPI00273C5D41|nr:Fe-S cluster assembly protein SufD [Alkalihalobacillus macyae]MDP4552422.1 Fe-S cluster assembly protein SufD [Alkalihalobacillus macyae]